MSLKFPNLPKTLNPTDVAELKTQDPREYFREWYTDANGIYDEGPEWFYAACDWRQKPGAPAHYVHPPRRPRGRNGRLNSVDRTTFHPALAEYSNENPPHILYLWDRLDNGVPKSWPLPPKLVDRNGAVIMDTDPESGKQIACRFWGHAPEQVSRSPDLWLMEYLERVDSRMQRRDWIALMISSELDGGHRPKANRINNVLSEYRKRFNMQPWRPSAKSAKAQQKLIDIGEITKPSSGNSSRGISPGPKDPSRPWNRQSGLNYTPYPPGFDADQYGSWNPWIDYGHLCRKKERGSKRMLEQESDCDDTLPLSGPTTKRLKMKEKSRDQDDETLDGDVPLSQQPGGGDSDEESSLTSRVSNELSPSPSTESCEPAMKPLSAFQSPTVVSQQSLANTASIAPPVQDGTINACDIPQLSSKPETHVRTLAPVQSQIRERVNAPFDTPFPTPSQILDASYRNEHTMVHASKLGLASRWTHQDSLEKLRGTPMRHKRDVVNDLIRAAGVHPDQLSQRYRELDKATYESHNPSEFPDN